MKSLLFSLSLMLLAQTVQAESIGDNSLTATEAELATLINNHRVAHGKSRLPVSKSLTYVGRWHAWDAANNHPFTDHCNLHSWSNARSHIWDSVCYTSDHAQAAQMWDKPRQVTNNQFTGYGYENAAWRTPSISPAQAVDMWKNSPGHNDVILEQGGFAGVTFQTMGVGINNNYAFVWFSDSSDPQGHFTIGGNENWVFFDDFE